MLLNYVKELKQRFGFKCIPLKKFSRDANGKKSFVFAENWSKFQTEGSEVPDALFKEAQGIAILTGKISNLIVLDFDTTESVREFLNALNLASITDAADYVVKTSKGFQLFYTYAANIPSKIRSLPGLDVLSDGRLTFADKSNEGYEIIHGRAVSAMPTIVRDYLLNTQNKLEIKETQLSTYNPYKQPLSMLINDWMVLINSNRPIGGTMRHRISNRLLKKVNYRAANKEGQRHDLALHVCGVCAADPTIDENLYYSFCELFIEKVINPDDDIQMLMDYAYKRNFAYDENWSEKFEQENDFVGRLEAEGVKICYNPEIDKFVVYENNGLNRVYNLPNSGLRNYIATRLRLAGVKIDISKLDQVAGSIYDVTQPYGLIPSGKVDALGNNIWLENTFKPTEYMSYFDFRLEEFVAGLPSIAPSVKNFDLTWRVICNVFPEEEHRNKFLNDIAYHLKTKEPCQTAIIVMTKTQGIGKGILFDGILGKIYGEFGLKWEPGAIHAPFNGEIKGRLFIHCNEIAERYSHWSIQSLVNKFKTIIAENTLVVQSKGKQTENVPNHALIVMSTNEDIPFKLDSGDNRRFNFFRGGETPLREICPEIDDGTLLKKIDMELPYFLEYLAYLAATSASFELYRKVFKTEFYESILEGSIPESEKIANAIVNKDVDILEELVGEDFADIFNRDIVKLNLAYMKITDFKKYFDKQTYGHLRRALLARGVLFEGRYLPMERRRSRVCILNPQGDFKQDVVRKKEL